MANPKMAPCPKCGNDHHLAVYTYDNGWRHVECDKCHYLGPGEGSIKQAIKSHNERAFGRALQERLSASQDTIAPKTDGNT